MGLGSMECGVTNEQLACCGDGWNFCFAWADGGGLWQIQNHVARKRPGMGLRSQYAGA
jgi:hypothetical protein